VSFYFLWHPPTGLSPYAMFAFTLAMLLLIRICISAYDLPSAALTPELAPDYHERTTLLSYRHFFGIVGGVTMFILLYSVFLRKDADHPLGLLNKAGYETWGAIAAGVMLVAILGSSVATHHLIPQLNKPK